MATSDRDLLADRLLTLAEAATALRLSTKVVGNMCRSGVLSHEVVRTGGGFVHCYLIPESAVAEHRRRRMERARR
jgi:hypothetical protein